MIYVILKKNGHLKWKICAKVKQTLERDKSGLKPLDKGICYEFWKPYVFNTVVSIFFFFFTWFGCKPRLNKSILCAFQFKMGSDILTGTDNDILVISIGNRMNAGAFRDLWARVMLWKFSKLKASKQKSIEFFLSRMWWLDALQAI